MKSNWISQRSLHNTPIFRLLLKGCCGRDASIWLSKFLRCSKLRRDQKRISLRAVVNDCAKCMHAELHDTNFAGWNNSADGAAFASHSCDCVARNAQRKYEPADSTEAMWWMIIEIFFDSWLHLELLNLIANLISKKSLHPRCQKCAAQACVRWFHHRNVLNFNLTCNSFPETHAGQDQRALPKDWLEVAFDCACFHRVRQMECMAPRNIFWIVNVVKPCCWIPFKDHPIKWKKQRRLAWSLRKDDAHKSRRVTNSLKFTLSHSS